MKQIIAFSVLLIFHFSNYAQTWTNLVYNSDQPGLEYNPLKGFATMWNPSNNFPRSIQGKLFGLNEIMFGMTDFDWTVIDNFISREAAKGNFAYLQVNIDPAKPGVTHLPDFLIGHVDILETPENLCPDWNNETLMTAMLNFIEAFGARYNDDHRVFLIHQGLYGMWGEWHVGSYGGEYEMTEANRIRLAKSYSEAFPGNRGLLARYAHHMPDPQILGYSDGLFFGQSISPSNNYYFHNVLKNSYANLNWKAHPIGGEIDPGLQASIWKNWPNTVGQDVTACLDSIHPTWLFSHHVLTMTSQPGSDEWDNAIRAQKMMGYSFFADKYRLSAFDGKPTVELIIQNKGIAPMYANWNIEIAVLDSNNQFQSLAIKKWNLDIIQADGMANYRSISSSSTIDDGIYKVLLRIVNPLETITTNAKPVRFANTTQDKDMDGWLTLGDIDISSGNTGESPIQVSNIFISDTIATLQVGETIQLSANVTPSNATHAGVTWVSDHPATAYVNPNGLVSAGPAVGQSTISAISQDGGYVSKSIITVEPNWVNIPGKVEAEDFINQSGIQTENCSDTGRGLNVGWIDNGDWLLYAITNNTDSSDYEVTFRLASPAGGGEIFIYLDSVMIGQVNCPRTGAWQNWQNVSTNLNIKKGTHNLKLVASKGGFNINYIAFSKVTATGISAYNTDELKIYPIPANNYIQIQSANFRYDKIDILGVSGKVVFSEKVVFQANFKLPLKLKDGLYILKLSNSNDIVTKQIIVSRH